MSTPLRVPLTDSVDLPNGGRITLAELCFRYQREFWFWFWPLIPGAGTPVWSWAYDYTADLVQLGLERNWGTYVNAEPIGTGKSIRYSVLAPAWDWLHNPWAQWLNVSSNFQKVATRDARRMRLLLQTPEYQMLAAMAGVGGQVALSKDQNQKVNFANVAGGARHCYGSGSDIIGVDAHRFVLDDMMESAVANWSPERRQREEERIWTMLHESIYDRARARAGDDPDHAPVPRFVVGQRLTPGDVVGRYIKQREREVAEHGDTDITITVIPEDFDPTVPGGVCPADPRTIPGQPLFPDWGVRRAAMEKHRRRSGGARFVATRYGQRPTLVEGGLFKRSSMGNRIARSVIAAALDCDRVVIAADLNLKGGQGNDPISIQGWGIKGARPRRLVEIHGPLNYRQTKLAFRAMCRLLPMATDKVVEGAANGFALVSELEHEIPGVRTISTRGLDKYGRAKLTTGVYDAGQVDFVEDTHIDWHEYTGDDDSDWVDLNDASLGRWIDEVTGFPSAAHDDSMDAKVYALWLLLGLEHEDKDTGTALGDWF